MFGVITEADAAALYDREMMIASGSDNWIFQMQVMQQTGSTLECVSSGHWQQAK